MLKILPTKIDRYPAKMVTRLAEDLVEKYASDATSILDPFCGSGAILNVGKNKGVDVFGIDLNPIANLYYHVKIKSFSKEKAYQLAEKLITLSTKANKIYPMKFESKAYWFTEATLFKLEKLRYAYKEMQIYSSDEGKAILLCLVLSVRLSSMADQRSPKPFISKIAKETRGGKHFDPIKIFESILVDIVELYGNHKGKVKSKFIQADITEKRFFQREIGKHSHIITSPPYINAQDYFRNFKLELFFLEGLMNFNALNLKQKFIGTERGELISKISVKEIDKYKLLIPKLKAIEKINLRLSSVVLRYFHDMENAFGNIENCLNKDGKLIIVCGDNLVGGVRIRTWEILKTILKFRGFELYDFYKDKIENRMLPPKRSGHKGLIKEEVVCAYQRRN
jgi:SAM-dependent methyltransferase